MQLIAGLMGILLAFASMWVGWYVFRVWPELYEQRKLYDERMKKKQS
ncbi:MAG: hypothetical protein Q9M27_01955 [Mariprofundaceae bacterium]|nr:hypothetical protein [Mariprofundaceae bacterium]